MKIKRVLLINPPDTRPPDMLADKVRIGVVAPLGLAYIAAVLEQQGIEVKILDCVAEGQLDGVPVDTHHNGIAHISAELDCDRIGPVDNTREVRYGLTDAQIASEIGRYKPNWVGVSCLFSNKSFDAHNVCRIVKQVNPEIITVMGGSHPTAVPEETLRDKNIDYLVKGEGDYAILELMIGRADRLGDLWPAKDFIPWERRDSLEKLPLPARHLLNMPKYLYSESPHSGLKRLPVATMSTSRGCPGRCEFCAIRGTFGDDYRTRSPENVLAEIEHLINTYHIKELHFEDDNLTANKKRAMLIFQGIIDREWDLAINSPSGLAVFAMDEELLDKMKEAGYYSVSFAIESGVPWVLKDLMHKNVDLVKAKRLIKYARFIGLKIKAFFILGYPGETKETMRQTVEYAGGLGADWCLFFPATALPGTAMERRIRANNWLVDPHMDYRYYFFKPNIRTPEFGPDDVLRAREEANRQINFENNINMREGNYERAREDFGEVVKLYPHLDLVQEALQRAESKLGL